MRDGPRRLTAPPALPLTLLAVFLLITVLGPLVAPVAALADDVTVTTGPPAADAPATDEVVVPTDPVELGVVAAPLAFVAGVGVALELADGRRFLDRLELRDPGEDQVLINDLTTDDYVAGVAEMPGRWHLEALKAQAVAARTYAWYQSELGTFTPRGYDICDTVACQAFRGAAQQEGEDGDRWRDAVDATSGEVLLDPDGQPILARYFSTSGGRTLPNEVVFPRSGPRDYLVGVDDPHDAVSPYHRWEVTFTREEFDAILGRGETLAAVVPVASVERLGPVHEPGADLRVTGEDGTEVVVDSVDLRSFVSSLAPQLYPDRFPTARADGLRPLPSTLPSSRFEVAVGGDDVTVSGRGWGHGVGMGQYGARGRAESGAGYADILAAYYGGVRPTTSDALPDRIRVALSQPAVGSVTPDGPMSITAAGEPVVTGAAGTWTVAGAGDGVRLTGPPGWGEPASISRTEEAIGVPTVPRAMAVEAVSAVPGALTLEVIGVGGEVVLRRPLGAAGAGRQIAVWTLDDAEGDPVPSGAYRVAITLTAEDGSVDAAPLPVQLSVPTGAATSPDPTGAGSNPPWLPLVLTGVVLSGTLFVLRARRPDPDGPAGPNHPDPRRSR